jgi:hypothetical protein
MAMPLLENRVGERDVVAGLIDRVQRQLARERPGRGAEAGSRGNV